MRKKYRRLRSDRNYVIYVITNLVSLQYYIGLAVTIKNNCERGMADRWKLHLKDAIERNRTHTMSQNIRAYGAENFKMEVIEVVRGKAQAHKVESIYINCLRPELNDQMKRESPIV